jgi:hypothetical protein
MMGILTVQLDSNSLLYENILFYYNYSFRSIFP